MSPSPTLYRRRQFAKTEFDQNVRPAAVWQFARNESKLLELQEYLGGIRQHLQRMASELDSPPAGPPRGARGLPATQAVVFRPWTRRHRSVSSHRPMVTLRY